MGKITFQIPDALEQRVREYNRKKGDLSKIGEAALEKWLEAQRHE